MMCRTLPFAVIAVISASAPGSAETPVALRTIPAQSVLTAADVGGAGTREIEAVLGLEARVTIYSGRPVRRADLTEPAVVDRNTLVEMTYADRGIVILAMGRALGRGAVGDRIQIMNLTSRRTVTATVAGPGAVSVP